jgi:PIN domain nuclease of toxin-antitoxin system
VRYVSLVSVWEVAINVGLRKLHFPVPFEPTIAAYGCQPLLISFDHVAAVSALPNHHRDPFDRLLIAQAHVEGLTIVSADRHFGLYGVPLVAM